MSDIQTNEKSLETLWKHVQTIQDTLAILALQVDYTKGADTMDGNTYAEAFAPDAVLDQVNNGGAPVAQGRAAIAHFANHVFRQQTHTIHMTMNQRVTSISGDSATGFCYFLQRSVLKTGGRTELAGRYDDEYQRTAAGWKIRKRILNDLIPKVAEGLEITES